MFTEVIHKAQLLDGNRVYCVTLPKRVEARFSKSFDLKEKLFTFLRSVEGIEVMVILTELNPKESTGQFAQPEDILMWPAWPSNLTAEGIKKPPAVKFISR